MASEEHDQTDSKKDPVLEFMEEFLSRSMRIPESKWKRIMSIDKEKEVIMGFVERDFPQVQGVSPLTAIYKS